MNFEKMLPKENIVQFVQLTHIKICRHYNIPHNARFKFIFSKYDWTKCIYFNIGINVIYFIINFVENNM